MCVRGIFYPPYPLPLSAPLSGAYVAQAGTHTVTYTLTSPHGRLGAERVVIVKDVDECTYDGDVAMFRHGCGSTARCVNTDGAYACAVN